MMCLRIIKPFISYLTEGVEISDFINGKTEYYRIKLIDFEQISNNDFLVVNQLEITEDGHEKDSRCIRVY